jgi:hypothetical protein
MQSLHIKQSQYKMLGADDETNEFIVNFKQQLKVLAREILCIHDVYKSHK